MVVHLHWVDVAVVAAYAIIVTAIGLWASRGAKNASDYFLAGRSMNWFMIGFALFASNISSTTMVGLAGDAYSTGISVYNYEWMAALVLVIYIVFFLPMVLNSQVYTIPEYLERRYDRRARTAFAGLTLFLNIVVDTAASLYAGALLLGLVFPDAPTWQIVAGLAVLTGIYTVIGGLSAVMITEVIQAILLLIGSLLVTIFAFQKLDGGWSAILSEVPAEKLSLIRPLDDAGVSWLGLLTGVPLLGLYFWGANQFMAQRMLAAKTLNEGRWGALLAGLLKLPVLFIMVLPGTAAILLYPNLAKPDLVFPTLMFDLLPIGILGLVLAGFVAALMSTIASTLNSASTLVTMDFVRLARPGLSSAALVRVGRIATFTLMVLAVLWAPQIARFDSLFKYLQQVLSYTVGPFVALFVIGSFWPRANARGAFLAIVVGLLLGASLFTANEVLDLIDLHFLYVAPILFVVSGLVLVLGSLTAPAPSREQIETLLWKKALSAPDPIKGAAPPFWLDYRVLGAGLLAVAFGIVFSFR